MSGDSQQFEAEPQPALVDEHGAQGVVPTVRLLWMTPDPLGALAAMSSMYSGRVVRDLVDDLTHEDRMQAWADVQATHLRAPMEAVKLHFLLEGVDRAFTHQLVRQRTAAYAQESLRFAVVGDLRHCTTLPPSLQGTSELTPAEPEQDISQEQAWRMRWDEALGVIDRVYHYLVETGMPAEEARGLLPHCTATRVHYVTDLRNLLEHAGNRLCTQAQFHWRSVFTQIAEQIRTYVDRGVHLYEKELEFAAIAEAFKPICYQLGRCPFTASFDRDCTIRGRVQRNAEIGRRSALWDEQGYDKDEIPIQPIHTSEWLMDPAAARRQA